MKLVIRSALLLFVLCYASQATSLSLDKSSKRRQGKRKSTMSYIERDKGIKRIVLDNGLVVLLKEKHTIPMVAMQMWVKAGSVTEGKNLGSGLSHYFEHMLGKQTKTKKENEAYYNSIRSMGGSDVNAYTSYDRTVYHFTVRSEYFKEALSSLSDMIMNSVFDEEASKREINVILKEINLNDDNPSRYLWKMLVDTVYKTHHYRYPVIGYRDLFTSLGKKDIIEYYNTMYSPNNMILTMVGDFNLDDAEKEVKATFKDFKRKKLPSLYIPKEPTQLEKRELIKEFGVNTTKMLMAYPTVNALSKDVFPLDTLAIVLGDGRTSRLYKTLKDKKGLVNAISAASWTPKYEGLFTISADVDYKNLKEVRESIKRIIFRIKRKGISNKELKRAKQKVLVSFVRSNETLKGYASSIAMGEFLGNLNYHDNYVENIKKVRNKDIIRVALKYLKDSNLTTVALAPKGTNAKSSPALSKKDKAKELTKRIILKNGITLLIRKDSSIPLVSFNALFSGGYIYESKDNQGIYNFLFSSLLKGTKRKSAQDIAAIIEDTGGSISAGSQDNFSSIGGSFLKEHFGRMFSLFLDILSNAKFPKSEMQKVRRDILHSINIRDDDIWRASRYHLRKVRHKDTPYSYDGLGTKETIEQKISIKSIQKLYRSVITPRNMVLSVFGDIDEKTIIKLLSKKGFLTKAFFKRSSSLKEPKSPISLAKTAKDTQYLKADKKQSIIKIMFDAPSYKEADSYPLMLLSYVFSGIGSRLFMDLRDKEGLAYSTGGFYQSKKGYGLFLFYIGTEPDKKDRAIKGILRHIDKVKKELILDSELNIAKNSAIGRIIKGLETLEGQASIAALYEKLGLGHNYYYTLIEKIKKVTKEDIKRVANKYFTDEFALSVVESASSSQ